MARSKSGWNDSDIIKALVKQNAELVSALKAMTKSPPKGVSKVSSQKKVNNRTVKKARMPFKSPTTPPPAIKRVKRDSGPPKGKERKGGPESGPQTGRKRAAKPPVAARKPVPTGRTVKGKGKPPARTVSKAAKHKKKLSKVSKKPIPPAKPAKPVDLTKVFKWYVLYLAPTARDKKVKIAITRNKKNEGVQRQIKKVVSLRTESHEFRNGEPVIVRRRRFPGYLFVHCKLTDEVKSYLQTTKGVISILMGPGKIVATDDLLAAQLLLEDDTVKKNYKDRQAKRKEQVVFEIGQDVTVWRPGQAWHGTNAEVDDIDGQMITVKFKVILDPRKFHTLTIPAHQVLHRDKVPQTPVEENVNE